MKLTKEKIKAIRTHRGKTGVEIASITGFGINTVWHYMRGKRVEKNWSECEMQKLTEWRLEGISYAEIAKRLRRPANSVKIKMCRHKKEVLNDPQKRIVLYYLTKAFRLESNPLLVLKALRKARIFEIRED